MQRKQQYLIDSLRRVQAFLDTHADVVGPLKDTEARKQLDAAVERATTQVNDQGAATRQFAGSGNAVRQRVGGFVSNHMVPLAKFSRANLRGVPDFKALAHVPHSLRSHSLVAAARAMATAALPYSDALVTAQFPADTIQELGAAASALSEALDERVSARSRRVVASAGIRQELVLGREAVAMLDPIVTKKLVGQTDLLAGWQSAKRVTAMPQASAPTLVPPTTGSPAVTATMEVKATAA